MNLPLAPLVAGIAGVATAAACLVLPASMMESLVMDSGIPSVIPAAAPPLGMTARFVLAGGIGGLVAVFSWLSLFLLLGSRTLTIGKAAEAKEVPVLRRADAHPDAPARAPLLATRDLGLPFLEVTAKEAEAVPVVDEQELPIDLDQPLAAFDPQAIPEIPMPPPVAVAALRPRPAIFDSSERFETFELTPIRRSSPPPRNRPAPRPEPVVQAEAPAQVARNEASIHALLDRLEQGVVNRGIASGVEGERPKDAERGLEDALVTLRNLARRA